MNLSGETRGKGGYSRLCHQHATINNNNHLLSSSHPAHNFNLQDPNSSLHHFISFNNGSSKVKLKLPLDGIHTSSLTKATMHSLQYGDLLLVQEVVDHQKNLGDLLVLGDPRNR